MTNHVKDFWRTIVPAGDNPHGPLPPLLILLTVTTGLVDAFSYLALGHVFVANMTGNVIFLAFSLAGAKGCSLWASALAIAAFSLGALGGGRITHVRSHHRGQMLTIGSSLQLAFILAAFVYSAVDPSTAGIRVHVVLISLMGIAMGLQNAVVRGLAVPDLTTTVLTLTITGISADSRLAGGTNSKAGRRVLSALSMFTGALMGTALTQIGNGAWVLLVAVLLLAAVAGSGGVVARSSSGWAVTESHA